MTLKIKNIDVAEETIDFSSTKYMLDDTYLAYNEIKVVHYEEKVWLCPFMKGLITDDKVLFLVDDVLQTKEGSLALVYPSAPGEGSGDMLKSTYDPTNKNADAFDRSNHTGTQTAATISDFDTEVSNNSSVAANTEKTGITAQQSTDITDNNSHRGTTTGNPHSVSSTDVGLGNVTNDSQLKRSAGDINTFTEKATPVSADLLIIEDSADSNNKKKIQIGNLPTGGGGEANTGANVGTAGVGVFKTKSGVELQFKKINAGSSKVTITDDTVNDEVDIDVNESELSISAAQVTDFDTEVSNNSSVAANTEKTGITAQQSTDITDNNTHRGSAHAPSDAQKNSDITKAEIEAKLTGEISTHTHASKVIRTPHTWAIAGEIKVASGDTDFLNPFFISLATGQTMKVVKARYVINSGTNCNVKVQKNGVDLTGFTNLTATTTVAQVAPTAQSLAENDKLALIVNSVSGTPTNLSFTLFLESTV